MGMGAQPAMHTIAEWAGWPNQQCTRLLSWQGGPTSNPHDCSMGWMAQPVILSPAVQAIAERTGWLNHQYE